MKFRLNIQQQQILAQAKGISDGTFSYRVGSTSGEILKPVVARYTAWLTSYLETGKTFQSELAAWEQFVNSDCEGMPKYADPSSAAFVVCKVGKSGAQFLDRSGKWGAMQNAWQSGSKEAFGLYRAHGKILRVAMAADQYGFTRAARGVAPLDCALAAA